ncbi:MAG: hypothetical protein ACJ8F7_00210 [Gemmataceae bacterium]
MKRRRTILATAAIGLAVLAALAGQKKPEGKLLVLEWAGKSSMEKPPVAVLIEFGGKDTAPTDWSGKAAVTGAKIVHREGYRFRPKAGDVLTEPDGWTIKSHRGMRVPQNQPAVARQEGIATVGVVLHLSDLAPDAALNIETTGDEKAKSKVPLADVLTGKPQPLLEGRGVVRLISTATPIATGKTEDDFPAACYGPDGTLWVAWIGYHVKDESRRAEQKQLQEQPKDFKAYRQTEFGDQLFVKYYRDGKWSDPIAITDEHQDLVRCAIAADGEGSVVVTYSANRDGRHDLYARSISATNRKPSSEQRITGGIDRNEGHSYLSPVMATDQGGNVHIAAQTWSGDGMCGVMHISKLKLQENGWSAGGTMGSGRGGGAQWNVALAAAADGHWRVACDGYSLDDYDIELPYEGTPNASHGGNDRALQSSRFEARPSIAYDPSDRLWIAYEEGPELWGKDFGALEKNPGEPLYSARSVRVVCLEDGKLMRPVAELPTSNARAPHGIQEGPAWPNYERALRYAYPKIGIDGKGRVWLTYRQKFGSRYSSIPGSYWLTFARRLDGDHWSEPIELHHSDGLLDHRPVLLPHKDGGLLVVHNTDGRYTTPGSIDNDIYISHVDLPGDPVPPKLEPHDPGKKDPKLVERAKREAEAVKRIRDYRLENAGESYRLLRGEFHRHTELSWDGGPDGSLEDMFRYAIDSAQMDWIGNGDHDNGAGREYSWWLVQKFTDAYHVPGHFTPMFSYERSVPYPHGHRNCVFAQRGVRTLPRLAEPEQDKRVGGVHADDTKMLYRYLHELGGVCAAHTSATSMGTDWRDNDPDVEPFVEIYQGDRMSYEMEGAPRAGYDPKTKQEPANIAGWFPKGFIDHALGEKGYKLGFESSSDHWSTHISYCVVLAEKNDRQSILDGMKKRHVYGATDDIICDVRSGGHVMGDEFKTTSVPAMQVKIVGTKNLAGVDVLKDSKVVAQLPVNGKECAAEWKDPDPTGGVHYYYLRVRQSDGELAWTSPMWIDYQK